MADVDAVLVGGPRDGTRFAAGGVGLVELEIDGLVHRYIRTTTHRGDLLAYTYDGEIDPDGAADGVENARARQASPLADTGPGD
jgi:hypothetical protein